MNYKMDLSETNQELLVDAGVKVENREYSPEEIKHDETIVANHIMSKSSKNGDLANETIKYTQLINILERHIS